MKLTEAERLGAARFVGKMLKTSITKSAGGDPIAGLASLFVGGVVASMLSKFCAACGTARDDQQTSCRECGHVQAEQ